MILTQSNYPLTFLFCLGVFFSNSLHSFGLMEEDSSSEELSSDEEVLSSLLVVGFFVSDWRY